MTVAFEILFEVALRTPTVLVVLDAMLETALEGPLGLTG